MITERVALQELTGRLEGLMAKPHPMIAGEAARKVGFELRQAHKALSQPEVASQIVSRIDRRIDQIRATLKSRCSIDEMDAASWQAAWDQNPDLKSEEKGLFIARAIAHDFEIA